MNISSLLDIVSGKRKGLFPGMVRTALRSLTPVYRNLVNHRNAQFDSGKKPGYSVAAPVISIGNITTGGTGKTPMVIWVCNLLQQRNIKPGIVSRGYGSTKSGESKNDEALELESRLPRVPHVQNPNRVLAAAECIKAHQVSAVVLDDGFQHRRLARDLDIVLIDASNPFGYDYLLPRGLLREPVSSLGRANAIIISRSECIAENRLLEIRQQIESLTSAPIAVSRTTSNSVAQFGGNEASLESFESERWYAFSAIGNPDAFEKSLGGNGLSVCGSERFRDHHWYTELDCQRIADQARSFGADHLICTHKDLVKIGRDEIDGLPLFALMIDVEVIEGRERLEEMIVAAANK